MTDYQSKLAKELHELRKDAERYRYLRNRKPRAVLNGSGPSAGCWIDCKSEYEILTLLTGDDADAAIDAAMRAEQFPGVDIDACHKGR